MKTIKILMLLSVFAVLIASAVLIGQAKPAVAFGVGTSPQLGASALISSTEEVNQKEQLSKEIQELLLTKERELLKPGWLHIVYKTSLRKDVDRGFLTDGVPFPSEYVIEDWYLLDEELYAVKAVTFMRDLEGNVLQESYFFDGVWTNTSLNDSIVTGKFQPSIDGGYAAMVIASDTTLEKIDGFEAGFTVYEIKTAAMDGVFKDIVTRLYFDENGNLVKSAVVLINKDGTEVVDYETEFLSTENLNEPSEDVVKYLDEVLK